MSEENITAGNGHAGNEPELRSLEAQFRALTTDALVARYNFARQLGMTFGGARDMYGVLGYTDTITVSMYKARYARGGVAGRIIDCLPKATWRGDMWLEENDNPDTVTTFEQAWEDLEERLKIKMLLQRVDILSRLSTYAVLLIGAPGDLASELPKGAPDKLLYFQPYLGAGGPSNNTTTLRGTTAWDANATIAEFDIDPSSPRFGLPQTYQLKRADIAVPEMQRPVHWSRIIHVGEGMLEDEVYGQPALERCWNDLDNLEKVVGGGSEAFWLRANAGMQIDVDKDMALADAKNTMESLREQAESYQHQLTRMMRTKGVSINQLGSDVANFSNPADAIITLIAGTTGIPKRLLVGSEMGELASTQDRENFRDLVNGRQTGYAGPCIVRPLVDRLIKYGYLPTPKQYDVKWPHIEVLGEQEKSAGAQQWAATNSANGEVVFTDSEIRDHWYAMAPLTDEQRKEIADRKMEAMQQQQEAMQQQQEAMAAMAPAEGDPADPTTIVDQLLGDAPKAEKKVLPFAKRAAEESDLRTAVVKFDEKKHTRGKGDEGGQFVSDGGGGTAPADIKAILTEQGGKFEPGEARSEAVIPHTDVSLATKTVDAVAARLVERGYTIEKSSAGKQVLAGPHAKAEITITPDNKVTVVIEKTSAAHALPAPDEPTAKKLSAHRTSLPDGEKQALAHGFKKAVDDEGYTGDEDQFFAEQLALYQHAEEGDPRLKTWFGPTADDVLEDPGVKAYVDGLIKAQGAKVKDEKPQTAKGAREEARKVAAKKPVAPSKAKPAPAKADAAKGATPGNWDGGTGMTPQQANAAGLGWVPKDHPLYGTPGFVGSDSPPAVIAPPTLGSQADPAIVKDVLDTMEAEERAALDAAFEDLDDYEGLLGDFLLETYEKYLTEPEGESTAGTWLSGKTMDALKKAFTSAAKAAPKKVARAAEEAEDAELLRVLTAAIECKNAVVIDQILGLDTSMRAAGDVEGHPFYGNQYTSGYGGAAHTKFPHDPAFDPAKAYVEMYQSRGPYEFRPSAVQSKKLHEAFSQIASALRDPDIGVAIFDALRGMKPETFEERLHELETGAGRVIPGGRESDMFTSHGPLPKQLAASLIATLLALLEDPATEAFTRKVLADAVAAGSWAAFTKALRLAPSAAIKDLAFNPDQPRDEHGRWIGDGGAGAANVFYAAPDDALASLEQDQPATVSREDLRGVLEAATKSQKPDIDLTKLTIEDTPLFAGGLNRSRLTMPQIPDEHRDAFFAELQEQGIGVEPGTVSPTKLLPTQNEINAGKVGAMLAHYDKGDKTLSEIMISRDNYVLDGHHRWAVAAAVDFENPSAHVRQPVTRIMLDRDAALDTMLTFTKAHGIANRALRKFVASEEMQGDAPKGEVPGA